MAANSRPSPVNGASSVIERASREMLASSDRRRSWSSKRVDDERAGAAGVAVDKAQHLHLVVARRGAGRPARGR